ncbi:MAG: hypothetical protein AAB606_03590, partial [Patescibacteria group bacterium]
MKDLTKKILISLVSIGLVFGTVFLDGKLNAADEKPEIPDIEVVEKGSDAQFVRDASSYVIDSGKEKRTVLLIKGNVLVRFDKGSLADLSFSPGEEYSRGINLELKKGRFWVNSINSARTVEVSTSVIKIANDPGIFDVKYFDDSLGIRAVRHGVEVSFLKNALILPESREMEISEAKIKSIGETISKLRYAKLSKEFPFYEAQEPDEWVSVNMSDDAKFAVDYENKMKQTIRNEGQRLSSNDESLLFKLNGALRATGRVLTFDSTKRNQKEISAVMDYFDSAMYALLVGNEALAKKRIDAWKELAKSMPMDEWNEAFFNRLNRYSFAMPSDVFFMAKRALVDVELSSGSNVALKLITSFTIEVLDTAAEGGGDEVKARTVAALTRFGNLVQSNINKIKNQDLKDGLFFQYIQFNDFLDRRSELLREEFLRIAALYEASNISLISSKEEANDQRQFFISEKIKRMMVLKKMMDTGGMPFNEARGAALFVANQIDEIKPAFSGTAVLSYFDDQMAALSPFITFLRSENAENLRGSFDENFKQFTSRISEAKQVAELLAKAGGGVKISPFRREELAGIVADDFSGTGISDVRILLPEAEDDNNVRVVGAKLEGKNFIGIYDTVRKVFSELAIEGERIPNAVRLVNL